MKKLLITSMAAVAVSICAKAEFTDNNESFEGYTNEGPLFGRQSDNQDAYEVTDGWVTTATPEDGIFTVTNIANYVGSGTIATVSRPIPATQDTPNTKALAIDTSASLMRNAITSGEASQTGYVMTNDESIFFDSLVQFTATESIPEPSSEDKLVIGLFADEDPEENADLGALDNATNLVVISAVLNQNGEIVANATNIIDNTDLNVGPEEWHRLTIQVMNNSGFDPNGDVKVPGFKVFVDKKEVKVNGDNKIFHSLVKFVNSGNVLKGVAFEGKGAVDDLVFTTTDPFAGGGGEDPEPEKVNVSVTINDFAAIMMALFDDKQVTSGSASYEVEKGSPHNLQFMLTEEYELVSSSPVASNAGGFYTITVEPNSDVTIEIVVQKVGGGSGATVDGTTVEFDANGEITNITTAFDGKTVSGNLDITKFKAYYVVSVGDNGVLSIKLNQKVAAPFAEELAEGEEVLELDTTIGEGESAVPAVGVRIKTYPGLWYGLGTATELGKWGQLGADDWVPGNGSKLQLKAAKPAGNAAFFMIQVRDTNPKQ